MSHHSCHHAGKRQLLTNCHSPIVTARVLSFVRYSMHGATVNPDPSNRTLCAIGTDTFGPNALALASSCLTKVPETE